MNSDDGFKSMSRRRAAHGEVSVIGAALVFMAAAPSGPAILAIHTVSHGDQFAYFSSVERCEAFRRQLEADWDQRARDFFNIKNPAQPTPKPVAGTAPTARCIPG